MPSGRCSASQWSGRKMAVAQCRRERVSVEVRQSQGRGLWRWGSWMAQEPDFTLLCTRPRGNGKSSVMRCLSGVSRTTVQCHGDHKRCKDSEWERLTPEARGRGGGEEGDIAPVWPKGRQITVWEGAEVWVQWSTLKRLCLFLSLRVGVEKIQRQRCQ